MKSRYLVIGTGLSGAVLAEQLVRLADCTVEMWEERAHIAGNCYTERDGQTGIMVHEYGPHIFNTDKKEIWDYVNGFGQFLPYVHRVKARVGNAIYSLPVNLHTINQFFGKTFSPAEAAAFIQSLGDVSLQQPANFEEQALRFIGTELYQAFFYGYTKKQWGCEPRELPASILKRIPVRFNYDDNYHPHFYTGIPVEGYTKLIERMIKHPAIQVFRGRKFLPGTDVSGYDHVFYTGPLDAFFDHCHGRLGYRTVAFEKHHSTGDFQGTAQVNYCDASVPYTRITEYKYFTPWEHHQETVYCKEYSRETHKGDVPFYPKRLAHDKLLLRKYREAAEQEAGVTFLGRQATYRYMDMHHVIQEAIEVAHDFVTATQLITPVRVFANQEQY